MSTKINIDDIFTTYAGVTRDANGTLRGNKPVIDLYKSLTDEDRWLIMLYFRWITLQNRNKYGISSLVNTERSAETSAFLEGIQPGLSKVTDWEFVGMIDFGYQGAVHCSRGNHALRYAYYAYSPSTDQELIFGSSCGSDFFDVPPDVLKGIQQELEKAKFEVGQSFILGRCPKSLTHTDSSCILSVLKRNKDLAALCTDNAYIGRTPFELWGNFVSKGIQPPKTLLAKVRFGYRKAAKELLLQKDSSDAMRNAITIYENTKLNDSTFRNNEISGNKGVSYAGEIIAPYSACTLFDALRASVVEEFIEPTLISSFCDVLDFYDKIAVMENIVNTAHFKLLASRAELIMRATTPKLESDITTLGTLLLISVIRNDLRLPVALLGLTPNSSGEVPLFGSDLDYSASDYFGINNRDADIGDDLYWEEVESKYLGNNFSPNIFEHCWGATYSDLNKLLSIHNTRDAQYVNTKRSLLFALFILHYDILLEKLQKLVELMQRGEQPFACVALENQRVTKKYKDILARDIVAFGNESPIDSDEKQFGTDRRWQWRSYSDDLDTVDDEDNTFEVESDIESFDEFESSSDAVESSTQVSDDDYVEEEYYEEESESYDEDSFDEDEEDYEEIETPSTTMDIFNMLNGGGLNGN